MRWLNALALPALALSVALAQSQSSPSPLPTPSPRLIATELRLAALPPHPDNLETFPTILPDPTTTHLSRSATAFDPSRFTTGHGPALPPSYSINGTLLPTSSSRFDLPSSTAASAPSPRTTLISASHTFPSLDPSASEYVVTSTVDGSVATVTVTNTAEAALGVDGSSGAGGRRAARWAVALAGVVVSAAMGLS
ncbi:hypothetical protein JCM10450v2_004504 [Rhodotorula kratochvilovae]